MPCGSAAGKGGEAGRTKASSLMLFVRRRFMDAPGDTWTVSGAAIVRLLHWVLRLGLNL